MKGDTVDFFIEDIRRGGSTAWQYRRGREWHDFQVRQESILRKSGEESVVNFYHNEVGTLDCDPEKLDEGYHLSMNWTGFQPGGSKAIVAWLDMVAAGSAKAGMDIARECPQPTLNWVFADREGHIGMQGCGRFPKRASRNSGLTPVPAWNTANHWRGLHDKEILPRVYDPPEGFIATANEDISMPGGPQLVTQPVPAYRKQRINERLAALPRATVEDMQDLQYDLVSIQARELLRVLLPPLPEGPFKERLSNWDCRYSPESKEAALFQKFYINVLMEIFGHDGGIGWRRTLYLISRVGFSIMVVTACDRLLKQTDSLWWHGRDKAELIRRAAEKTAREPDVVWRQVNRFHFADRFFGAVRMGRVLGFTTPVYAMPGCFATPFQGHVQQTAGREITFAPSYHFVADLRTDEAWSNLPGGPSESRFSRFYKSDLALWFEGEFKRLTV